MTTTKKQNDEERGRLIRNETINEVLEELLKHNIYAETYVAIERMKR